MLLVVVIVCYAPTNEADDLAKDSFWNQLSSLVSSFKQRERVCLVGDFNATPGQQSDVNVPCRGPFGMGEENDNSEKLLSFCVSHDLLVGGTWFRHRLVHRYTFNPPDQQMRKKMLDHTLFGSRHRSCLHNVRTRRGKNTLTDHEMVIAEVRFKLVAQKPRSQPKVCSAKLRDEVTSEAFCTEVKRYLDERDIVEGVEQSRANFRTALNAAATKLLIPEKRVHKPWITVETLALIRKQAELQLRKHSSAEALLVFSNCCKEVRKALRSDKISECLERDLGPIRFDEVLYAVRKLKNGKASGPDNISAEMLKSHNGIAEWLWDIVNKGWTEENLPQDWKLAEVVPLYKNKGKRSECGNYRGISLLSVPGKVVASIILNRCKDAHDQVLREEQCGFRKSRGCTDQLFALRQIIEKCMAFQLDVSFCFIDFRAAFDSVDREMMYKIMKHNGISQKVVNVIRNSYEGFKCCVKAEGEKGQMFDVRTGVRQGDVWSPILFGLVINYVLANSIQGGTDIGRCVADLDFTDDVALLGVSDSEVQANLHRTESSAEAVGLMINVGKTKNMGVKCKKTRSHCTHCSKKRRSPYRKPQRPFWDSH